MSKNRFKIECWWQGRGPSALPGVDVSLPGGATPASEDPREGPAGFQGTVAGTQAGQGPATRSGLEAANICSPNGKGAPLPAPQGQPRPPDAPGLTAWALTALPARLVQYPVRRRGATQRTATPSRPQATLPCGWGAGKKIADVRGAGAFLWMGFHFRS